MGGGSPGRPQVQGATEGTGLIQGVRRVDGSRIPDESSDDSTWEGIRDTTKMENPGYGMRAMDLPNGIPGKGRSAELPDGGIPRPSGDLDGNAGALPAPACPRHRDHSVGEKPPPPTVRPMRHDGLPAGPERQAPCHSPVS